MKKVFTIIQLLVSFLMTAQAQWSDNPAVNNAIGLLPGEQAIPKVAVCPNGNAYIAFFSNESGNYDVRLQLLDSQGNTLWQPNGILISNQPSMTWLTDWDIAADPENHCILTWQDIRNGNNNIYAYRIAPDGSFVWGSNGIALSDNDAFNASPKVSVTAAGNAVFAWSSDNVIIMQKLNPAGVKQWGAEGITLSSANTLSWPQLLPVGTDDIILKYFNDSGPAWAPTRHVYAQRYNSQGAAVWSSPTVISNAGGISAWTQIFPFINDGSDGFYIAWHDDRDNDMRASVWVHHISSSGIALFPANGVEASTASSFNHFYPYLALPSGSQDVYVFWNEMSGDQNQRGISGQKLSQAGTRQWGNSGMTFIPLSATDYLPIEARATATDVIVIYEEGLSASSGILKAMRIGSGGNYLWPGDHVTLCSVNSSKVHSMVSKFQNNQLITCWEDDRNGASDIYAQNLLADGSLGPGITEFGSIQGQVTLNGGSGNITQVVVSAGGESTLAGPGGLYYLAVPVGVYTVTATLDGYYPGSVGNVTVLANQSTTGIDFILDPVPTTGFIEGQVTLGGGTGEITEATVKAGSSTANPDAGGFYSIEVPAGVWEVEASLSGYVTQTIAGVVVNAGSVTPDINFTLPLEPTTGWVQGNVTISGNLYDVTEATVEAGGQITHPSANGFYFFELPVGNFNITASHPWTTAQTIENVEILPGLTTTGITFQLQPLRTDIIVKATDQYGSTLLGTEVALTGPETTYNGLIENDSLVFANAVYGFYHGISNFPMVGLLETDALIDQQNNHILFLYIYGAAANKEVGFDFLVSPNPVTGNSRIILKNSKNGNFGFRLFSSAGKLIGAKLAGILPEGTHEWPLDVVNGNRELKPGIYYLQLENGEHLSAIKLVVQ